MEQLVGQEHHDGIAVLVLDSPPGHAFCENIRSVMAALEVAVADPAVVAIVIRGAGADFCPGEDLGVAAGPPASVTALCAQLERSPKPVVAALSGRALGAGCAIALAAHWRIADAGAEMGLPEVTVGLLPGAGSTQRLARLIGAEQALDMMISGQPVAAVKALAIGLLDQVVEADLPAAALRFAGALVAGGAQPRPVGGRRDGMRDPVVYGQAISAARRAVVGMRLPGPRRIIDCVEAALLLPFAQGLDYETAALAELAADPQSAALRHVLLAERAASLMPGADHAPRPLRKIAVVGLGRMGAGIAHAALSAGFAVAVLDRDNEGLSRGLERIARLQDMAVEKGRMTASQREADWARLSVVDEIGGVRDADLAIEAFGGDFEARALILRALDAVLAPGAVLASNTAGPDLDALAAQTGRPGDVIGLHFFDPAHVMRLMEIVAGDAVRPDVVATALAFARRLGKVAVYTAAAGGLIGARLQTACGRAAQNLVLRGASPAQVDRAMRVFGMPLGPFEMADRAGLQAVGQGAGGLADRLLQAGRFGRAAGRGWYRYETGPDGGRRAIEDPEVAAIVAAEREVKGITARAVPDDEIRLQCLVALANEGARLLHEGAVQRASDLDVVQVFGFGFPRWEGGPMHWADRFGVLQLRNALLRFQPEAPDFWVPAPQLDAMIRNGLRFADGVPA